METSKTIHEDLNALSDQYENGLLDLISYLIAVKESSEYRLKELLEEEYKKYNDAESTIQRIERVVTGEEN